MKRCYCRHAGRVCDQMPACPFIHACEASVAVSRLLPTPCLSFTTILQDTATSCMSFSLLLPCHKMAFLGVWSPAPARRLRTVAKMAHDDGRFVGFSYSSHVDGPSRDGLFRGQPPHAGSATEVTPIAHHQVVLVTASLAGRATLSSQGFPRSAGWRNGPCVCQLR